jgi:hypothetical protein
MEVLGRVKLINPVQQVSASFKKRELVVTTEEQYPQHILIEFAQDKTDLLNNYAVGEQVKVSIINKSGVETALDFIKEAEERIYDVAAITSMDDSELMYKYNTAVTRLDKIYEQNRQIVFQAKKKTS